MSGGVVSGREALAAALHRLTCDPNCVNVDAEDYEDADALLASGVVREEAAVRAEALAPVESLFAGGPDTPCRTTRREEPGLFGETYFVECVEVPLDELRAALAPQDPA